jgi:integrase
LASVENYIQLAERPNTRRSYAAAVRHFEVEWRGLLPATPDAIAEYLATYATTQAISTLKTRLAGLARWHLDHGFQDPTKAPVVRRVLKGIRTAHNAAPRQARPIEFELLQHVSKWIEAELLQLTDDDDDRIWRLRRTRDQAMLLLGFWRGFRSDELTSLRFEHVQVEPGVRLTCFVPRSKADMQSVGQQFECPALSKLCPVSAFIRWQAESGLSSGPVFRPIDRWGHLSDRGLASTTIVPWLRQLFTQAGVDQAAAYSSHSLRRGFANWARSSGWDLKELMNYVGWRDVNSALRYLRTDRDTLAARFERGLEADSARDVPPTPQITKSATVSSNRRKQTTNVIPLPLRRNSK